MHPNEVGDLLKVFQTERLDRISRPSHQRLQLNVDDYAPDLCDATPVSFEVTSANNYLLAHERVWSVHPGKHLVLRGADVKLTDINREL